jgi:hypothetical protein
MTNGQLDACHGHALEIEIDGRKAVSHHCHATMEYPYTIGCFRGTPVLSAPRALGGVQGRAPGPPGWGVASRGRRGGRDLATRPRRRLRTCPHG